MKLTSIAPTLYRACAPTPAAPTTAPPEQQDTVSLSAGIDAIGNDRPTAAKEEVIRAMIRKAPDEESRLLVIEALSAYPLEALQRVQAYGTRLEVYDFEAGEPVPDYLPTLANPKVLGAYNTEANVLGADKGSLAAFVLLHEFAHALDASLGEVSEAPEWKNAQTLAKATDQVVREYATFNSSEYLAENTAAYLVADEALYGLIEEGLENELGTEGLTERQYMQMYQNFCQGRLQRLDPEGYALVDDMLRRQVIEKPAVEPKPAMNAEEWQEFLAARA